MISPDQDNLSTTANYRLARWRRVEACVRNQKKSSEASQAAINSASAAYIEYIHEKKKE